LRVADKSDSQFVLFGIDQPRIVVLTCSFQLSAFRPHQGRKFAGVLVPGGFSVVGLDGGSIAIDQF
jgi:hypothetical protein